MRMNVTGCVAELERRYGILVVVLGPWSTYPKTIFQSVLTNTWLRELPPDAYHLPDQIHF